MAQEHGSADEDALVRDILADPWDGLARSVYADWLEDDGRPHHAELARAPAKRNDERIDGDGYWKKARDSSPRPGLRIIHRDGFAAAQLSARDLASKPFRDDGAAWLREHAITWLELDGAADWAKVADAPALAGTRGLRLIGKQGPPGDLSGLAGLQALWLRADTNDMGWVEAVAKCEALRGLVRLVVPKVWLPGPEAVRALGHGPLASALRNLELGIPGLTDDAAHALLESLLADSLVTLSLPDCWLTDRTAQALAASPRLARLRNLDLRGNSIGEEGYASLAKSPVVARLNRLWVPEPRRYGASAYDTLCDLLGDRLQ